MLRGLPVTKLSMATTAWPSASSRSQRWLPRKPAAPVTRILTGSPEAAKASLPSHSRVRPARGAKLPRLVDVSRVGGRLRLHRAPELSRAENAELVPRGRQDEDVGPAR